MHTLLIWEEVPEKTRLFVIPNEVADKYVHFLEQAHNKLINSDDSNDGMNFLNYALFTGEEEWDEKFKEYRGLFSSYEVNLENPITDFIITSVYYSGFVL